MREIQGTSLEIGAIEPGQDNESSRMLASAPRGEGSVPASPNLEDLTSPSELDPELDWMEKGVKLGWPFESTAIERTSLEANANDPGQDIESSRMPASATCGENTEPASPNLENLTSPSDLDPELDWMEKGVKLGWPFESI